MKLSKTLALLGAVATLAVSAHAQRGQGGMRMMGGGQQPAWMLLSRDDVREDLKITDEQKDKLSSMQEEMMNSMRQRFGGGGGGGQRPSREEMQKMREEMEKEVNTKLAAILTPEQIKRLGEVSIQMSGSAAVMRPEIAKELGITEDQKTKIAELQQTMGRANRAVFGDESLAQDEKMARVRKNSEVLNTEIDKLLTPEQKTKLKAMGGAPFTRRDER